MTTVKCPHCGKPVNWSPESEFRPFCSRRCRLIDMGDWLSGSNAIPGPELGDQQLAHLGGELRPANDEDEG